MRRQAALALGRIGVDSETSLPALKNALHDKQAAVRAAASLVLGSSGFAPQEIAVLLTELLGDSSKEVQAAAIVGLGKIGPAAKAAVPLIHKIARAAEAEKDSEGKNESDLRVGCIRALGAIGRPAKEAAPLLLSWLSTAKSANVRTEIIEALGYMEAKEAVKVLEPLVHKEKGAEGVTAALALWRIEKSPAALAFLEEGLKEKTTRVPSIQALGQVGPAAHLAVPALIDILMKGKDLNHRALAAEALGRIGLGARPAIKVLVESLRVPHSGMRIHAARALGQFEEDAAAAVPRLLDLLGDPESPQVRHAAADALWLIDPDAADSSGI
jgi:HEAT repeat protein